METMQNILTRRSVRKFADKPIEPDKLHTILEAAMSGPCAVNAREWAFIVVTDREKLAQMAEDIDMRAVRPSRYEENRVHVNQW